MNKNEFFGYRSIVCRVLEYTQAQEHDQFEVFTGPSPPEGWPHKGNIEIKNLYLSPSKSAKRDLKNINLKIEGGQWIGIVGKAGSGKSTLLNALFRIAEAQSGQVLIDNVDVKTLGLHNLRKSISIIPQTPCMFQGTIRQNLDPLNQFTDEEIWGVLQECTLSESILKMEKGLGSYVTEHGMNFSAGQRQFICLARAMLEKSKILCCDEGKVLLIFCLLVPQVLKTPTVTYDNIFLKLPQVWMDYRKWL